MVERGHVALRTCAGCGQTAPRDELMRFATVDGRVVADPDARAPGRGAWLHRDRACAERAIARRGFSRAFRASVTVPSDTVDSFSEWPRSASES